GADRQPRQEWSRDQVGSREALGYLVTLFDGLVPWQPPRRHQILDESRSRRQTAHVQLVCRSPDFASSCSIYPAQYDGEEQATPMPPRHPPMARIDCAWPP